MVRRKAPTKEESALLPPFAALPDSAIYIPSSDEDFARARDALLNAQVLGNTRITKAGFGLDNDRHQLQGRLQVEMQNVIDLDRIFKRHGFGASTGVRAAIAMVLVQSLRKSKKVTTSNWSNERLTESQIRYAANDAHAPAMVFAHLAAWEATQPPVQEQRRREPREPSTTTP